MNGSSTHVDTEALLYSVARCCQVCAKVGRIIKLYTWYNIIVVPETRQASKKANEPAHAERVGVPALRSEYTRRFLWTYFVSVLRGALLRSRINVTLHAMRFRVSAEMVI